MSTTNFILPFSKTTTSAGAPTTVDLNGSKRHRPVLVTPKGPFRPLAVTQNPSLVMVNYANQDGALNSPVVGATACHNSSSYSFQRVLKQEKEEFLTDEVDETPTACSTVQSVVTKIPIQLSYA